MLLAGGQVGCVHLHPQRPLLPGQPAQVRLGRPHPGSAAADRGRHVAASGVAHGHVCSSFFPLPYVAKIELPKSHLEHWRREAGVQQAHEGVQPRILVRPLVTAAQGRGLSLQVSPAPTAQPLLEIAAIEVILPLLPVLVAERHQPSLVTGHLAGTGVKRLFHTDRRQDRLQPLEHLRRCEPLPHVLLQAPDQQVPYVGRQPGQLEEAEGVTAGIVASQQVVHR